jgi:hypothetical protein
MGDEVTKQELLLMWWLIIRPDAHLVRVKEFAAAIRSA